MPLEPNPDKPVIALSIGDPTIFGNFGPPEEAVKALQESIASGRFNGYAPSVGYRESREAVAKYTSRKGVEVSFQDVVLCSGCSSSLEMCLAALADPGQNVLMPRPGFPIYRTLAESVGVSVRSYNLLPERGWEADLVHLEQLVDEDTAAIIVTNPSNPCGSIMSRRHLMDLVAVASRLQVPIIADEIYEDLVFPGEEFVPLAAVSTDVPILSCSGLTKRFMVPGWRMGWIVIHDRCGVFGDEIRTALQSLSQRTIGSNTLVQGALPEILKNTPDEYHEATARQLYENAKMAYGMLSKVPGLRPLMPQGAMYMMVELQMAIFPQFSSELVFLTRLMAEESVFCLPGECFSYPGYVRLVITAPAEQLHEACERISAFCQRHRCLPEESSSTKLLQSRLAQDAPNSPTNPGETGGSREP